MWLRATALACILVACVAVALFIAQHSYSLYDDAYIYFRYVENLFAGCGLRFSCGDPPVEGFTSPLYFALLAAARLFTADLETASQVLGALFMAGALSLTATSALHPRLRSSSPTLAALSAVAVTVVLAFDHRLLVNSATGLETALACFSVALVFRRALSDDARPPIATSLLAVLARPELAVLVAALLVWPAARRARPLALIAGAFIVMTAARLLLFHDFLPNTFWAKSGGTPAHLRLGVAYVVEVLGDFPLILLAPLGLLLAPRRAVVQLLISAALAFAFFLYSGGDTFSYSRLAAPFIPTLTLLALLGLARALEKWRAAVFVMPTIAAAATLFAVTTHALPSEHGFPNVERWKSVGLWLAKNQPGARLATVPIGAIGYYSRLPLIDLVGLTNREIARGERVPEDMLSRTWIGHEKQSADWVLAQKPELLVFTKWRDHPWTVDDARAGFWAEWQLLHAIRQGRAPYVIAPAEISPGVHWLMFRRL